jgi:HD-GYP domain-containing protein (c-di-GMP phosphodiesterase class II)
MEFNALKEQRKLAQNYIIGYFSENSNFENLLSFELENEKIKLINLSDMPNDLCSLYIATLDEILVDGNKLPEDFNSTLKLSKPYLRLVTDTVDVSSLPNLEFEIDDSGNFLALARSINARASLVINFKKLQATEKEKNLKFIMQLVSILEDKDPYTRDHSARVAKYSLAIAMKYFPEYYDTKYENVKEENPEQYEELKHNFVVNKVNLTMLVAWAHDIGKNSIATNLLTKDTKLTNDEKEIIKLHTDFGASMIRKILGDDELAEAIENHHERIDGFGYHKLNEFSDIAKIIAISDSFDAMTTSRPYTTKLEDSTNKQKLKTLSEAINELQVASHLHFDTNESRMSQQLDTAMTDILVKDLKKDLSLIQEGKLDEVTLINGGLDDDGYIKAGFWDDKTQLYSKDKSVSGYSPKYIS